MLFVIFMSVTEMLGIVEIPKTTTDSVGGAISFSVVWFVYEGLKVLLVFYLLKIFGLVTFGGESVGSGGSRMSTVQRRIEERRRQAALRSTSSEATSFPQPKLP